MLFMGSMLQNALAAGDLPQISLGELTALPGLTAIFEGGARKGENMKRREV